MKEQITFTKKQPAVKSDGTPIEGEKNGRKWKLYHLIDKQGRKFSTFDNSVYTAIPLDKSVEITYTIEEKNGYKNYTIVPSGSRKAQEMEKEEKLDRVLKGLTQIYKQNEEIIRILGLK